ncbi:MAG: NUDIX domain-containing protein [Bacteroidales bacterium]|nr:NUDIX domain-containing protein [Bacteroidales bacterium]
MYKVFFYDRTIFLTEKPLEGEVLTFPFSCKTELIEKLNEFERNSSIKAINFYSEDFAKLEQIFFEQFIYIEAAGGLVENSNGDILSIFRLGKWDLPKGKVEKGERIEQAAIREVEEECGINDLKIINKLPSTFHTFHKGHTRFLKQTYWFKMLYEGNQTPKPQLEEDITEVKWFSTDKISEIEANTFISIIELLRNIRK